MWTYVWDPSITASYCGNDLDWGGHIVLAVVVLPRVLRERNPTRLLEFESVYERIGMPALVIQIITGLMLAYRMLPDVGLWFDMSIPLAHGIAAKLTLLALTFIFLLWMRDLESFPNFLKPT
ncbi:hypothetical protein QW180_17975 [Vibrio sinaloensis]|nr:hypothetical protein [Vibrio sinaloensis]